MEKLLLIHEVAAALRLSVSSVRRKKARDELPPVCSLPGCKCTWRESDIIRHIESQSKATSCNITPPNVSPTQLKREAKNFEQRQVAAKAALERHAANRTRKRQHNT